MAISGKVASLGKPYADGTPNLEINFTVNQASGLAILNPDRTSITLRIGGRDYTGSVLANKPKHDKAWISPTIHDSSGRRLTLGKVLTEAGFQENDVVRLQVTGTVVVVDVVRA
jgi:succinylglutamate desuccinylase